MVSLEMQTVENGGVVGFYEGNLESMIVPRADLVRSGDPKSDDLPDEGGDSWEYEGEYEGDFVDDEFRRGTEALLRAAREKYEERRELWQGRDDYLIGRMDQVIGELERDAQNAGDARAFYNRAHTEIRRLMRDELSHIERDNPGLLPRPEAGYVREIPGQVMYQEPPPAETGIEEDGDDWKYETQTQTPALPDPATPDAALPRRLMGGEDFNKIRQIAREVVDVYPGLSVQIPTVGDRAYFQIGDDDAEDGLFDMDKYPESSASSTGMATTSGRCSSPWTASRFARRRRSTSPPWPKSRTRAKTGDTRATRMA